MVIGDPVIFAIESSITRAYQQLGLRALGFFVIHVKGLCYGKRSEDATMLACSFDEVGKRIAMRGAHTATFADEQDAARIVDAFRNAVYEEVQRDAYFGISAVDFRELVYSNRIVWAPDGDQAFDNGSYVLHFDFKDHVRLIAFESAPGLSYDPATLRDVRVESDDFYGILENWRAAFENEWALLPKLEGTGSN
jgi:hypothetical protein